MPSRLRKAIGTVMDQTSIGLAIVSKTATGSLSAHIDLIVLKSTTHDKLPVDNRLVSDLIHLISFSRTTSAACVQSIARRIERTHNWIVALKCLHLVYKCLLDGGPYFPREAISATHLFNLSGFHGESTGTNQMDYVSFIRKFDLYLQERLVCFLRGKLQNRRPLTGPNPISDLKPPEILDRMAQWQRLLGRAIATRPTGLAKKSMLVLVSFRLVVRESIVLYKDVSDGLALLLDSFFGLQRQTCVGAYQTCLRAARQFKELDMFYDTCRVTKVARRSELPEVQQIPDELLATLNDFVKSENCTDMTTGDGMVCLKTRKMIESFRKPRKPGGGDGGTCRLSDFVSFGEESDEGPTANQGNSSTPGQTNAVNGEMSDLILLDELSEDQTKGSGNQTQAIGTGDAGNKNLMVPDLLVFDEDVSDAPIASSSEDWEIVLAETANCLLTTERNYSFSGVLKAVERRNPFLEDDHGGGSDTRFAVWSSTPSSPTQWTEGFEETSTPWSAAEPFPSARQQVWQREHRSISSTWRGGTPTPCG